jgi:hypothetical protein
LLEGYSIEEILTLPNDMLDRLVLCDEALVFKVGSAEILGKFRKDTDTLVIEPGHIDGGGEGGLLALAALAQRYGRREGLSWIEWQMHAVNCARPNLKLSRLLKNSLLTRPWTAASTKQARKRLIRRERLRTCAGVAT